VVPQTPLHKGKEKNATLKWVNTTYVPQFKPDESVIFVDQQAQVPLDVERNISCTYITIFSHFLIQHSLCY
jgi:hypothetical protein